MSTSSTPGAQSPTQVSRRDPADLAPSVDRSWAEEFVLEQRLLGVPGPRIGDALVTVESHVAESGESAQESFGDPRTYARTLAEDRPGTVPDVTPRTVVGAVLGVLGMLLATYAFGAWLEGEPAEVTTGLVAAATLLLVVLGGFLARATTVLRALVDHIWLVVAAMVLFLGASVGLMLLLRDVLLEVPAGPLVLVGLVMVAADAVLMWVDHAGDDTVLAPGETAPRRSRGGLAVALVMPVGTLLLLGLAWLLHLLG